MARPLVVSATLKLDTSDLKKGAAEVDQVGDQLLQKERRRAAQSEELQTGRGRAASTASEQVSATEKAAAERAAASLAAREQREQASIERREQRAAEMVARDTQRVADREAKEQAAAKRKEEREATATAKEAQRAADKEAKEQARLKRQDERDQAAASKAAERATAQAAKAQRASEQEAANENRKAAQRAGQLQFQLNDIFTGLGSGQSPLTVAIQQGPQITQIFGGFRATLAAIPPVAAAVGLSLAAVAAILYTGVSASNEAAARQRQFSIELQATGNVAAVTAGQLEDLVRAQAMRAGANRTETAQALSGLLSNPNLTSEQDLGRVLDIARDLARVTGEALPAATATLSQALDGTVAGARRLDQVYNVLTASELAEIRALEEQGRKRDAANIVIAAMERRFKGLNEQGLSPAARELNNLGNAWTTFADKVANHPATAALIAAGAHILKGAGMLIGGPPTEATSAGNAPNVDDLAKSRESLRLAEEAARRVKAQFDNATNPTAKAYAEAELKRAEARVTELRANVASVEQQVKSAGTASVEQQGAAQAAAAQAEIERRAKGYQDLINQGRSLNKEMSDAIVKRDRLKEAINSGLLAPDTLLSARQQLVEVNGEISKLDGALQGQQRTLDLEKKYAGMRPDQAAQERAYDTALKTALDSGATLDDAYAKAAQARASVLLQQNTQTQQQISLLGAEARAALAVADAYGQSRTAGIRAAAVGAAQAAEEQGQIAGGTAGAVAQQTLEKNAAATVAAAAEKNRAYSEEVAGLQRLTSAEAVSTEAAREAERANRVAAFAMELRAQAEASGSAAIAAAAEQQIAAYDRLSRQQLELERRRAANQLNSQYDPNVAYSQQMAQLQELQATGQVSARAVAEASKQYEMQRLQASRDATDGAIAGLRQYADEATNAGRAAADGVGNSMRSLEDAAVQAATTMKFSMTDFVNSALADLARLAIRQNITGPLASAASSALGGAGGLSGIFSWLFGGGGASPAATATGGYGVSVPTVSTGYMHSGGLIGSTASTRDVQVSAFANAPRYHTGGVVLGPDEVPIIAKRREEVLREDDPRHRFNIDRESMSAGAGTASDDIAARAVSTVRQDVDDYVRSMRLALGAADMPVFAGFQTEAAKPAAAAPASMGEAGFGNAGITWKLVNQGDPLQARKGKSGTDEQGRWTEEIILEAVEEFMAGQITSGRGKLTGAMQAAYGLQPVGRR